MRPLQLSRLYVLAAEQGRRTGTHLLELAVGDAPCFLWVAEDNTHAQGFYRSHGFEADGARSRGRRRTPARDPDGALMDLDLGVDPASITPPYEQVRAQLAAAIEAGALQPGTRLPTVRALAGELGLAVNTVARAYRELEQSGAVVTRGRSGTVVADDDAEHAAKAAAAAYAARARQLGLSPARALELVRDALGA